MFKLSWQGWLYGLGAAVIGGGASAVAAGFAQVITDPTHADVYHLAALMGTTFVIAGMISAAAYLSKSPLPQVETVTTEKTVNLQPAGNGVKVTTTTQQETKST